MNDKFRQWRKSRKWHVSSSKIKTKINIRNWFHRLGYKVCIPSISAKGDLLWRQRTTNKDYIEFRHGPGCSSFAGRKGGAQSIKLAKECAEEHTLIHEVYVVIQTWTFKLYVLTYKNYIIPLDFACSGSNAWAPTTGSRQIYWRWYVNR